MAPDCIVLRGNAAAELLDQNLELGDLFCLAHVIPSSFLTTQYRNFRLFPAAKARRKPS